nr:hypothetical protein [Homoserinimonas aerilata]
MATAAVLLCAGLLAGCTPAAEPAPTGTPKPSASIEASVAPPPPELVVDGTASDNLPFFVATVDEHLDAGGSGDGRSFIDALVAAGFDKSAMQVTPDATPTGGAVDSVLFSVSFGADCIIGQWGPGGFSHSVAPALGTGACLVGTTRAIDW